MSIMLAFFDKEEPDLAVTFRLTRTVQQELLNLGLMELTNVDHEWGTYVDNEDFGKVMKTILEKGVRGKVPEYLWESLERAQRRYRFVKIQMK